MSNQILHFTIGPVQSFVGQARRTRDLWAGSFLLSWLSGQAIAAVLDADGKIVFPVVGNQSSPKDPLLEAIFKSRDKDDSHAHPKVGSIPNRFKATFEAGIEVDVNAVKAEVLKKWQELADAVFKEYVEDYLDKGNNTQKIWDDQIAHFWEINWVLGDDDDSNKAIVKIDGKDKEAKKEAKQDGSWLDIRKNWRNHWPIPQEGDHCTLMGNWQELSGYVRSYQKTEQDKFWKELHKKPKVNLLELREGERLCAIALIKRLFPRLSKQTLKDTIGWIPGGSPEVVGGWPSTAYLATLPWFDWIDKHDDKQYAKGLIAYQNTVKNILNADKKDNYKRLASERATKIRDLTNLGQAVEMDGNLFQIAALNNHRMTPLSDRGMGKPEEDFDKDDRTDIIKAHKELIGQLGNNQPQPYYALLVMDGDNMGKLLQNPDINDNAISDALLQFTLAANDIVENHQGKLLYAGGDDVLAMLSMTKALDCSIALRKSYQDFFENQTILAPHMDEISASTAIIYSHFHTPLTDVLKQGHHALDNIAKEKNGRNSLALTVFKPEGVTAQWVGSFNNAVGSYKKLEEAVIAGEYSTSFFYNLRVRYPTLFDKAYKQEDEAEERENHAFELLLAEFLKGKSFKKGEEKKQKEKAQESVEKLLNAMGKQKGDEPDINTQTTLQIDAAYIARFIADNGHNFGRTRGQDQ